MAPDRSQAAHWASELGQNGFANHTLEEVKASLQVSDVCRLLLLSSDSWQDATAPLPALPQCDSFDSLGSEPLVKSQHNLAGSSYAGSSRGERWVDSCFGS
jgi:hypothetical protein